LNVELNCPAVSSLAERFEAKLDRSGAHDVWLGRGNEALTTTSTSAVAVVVAVRSVAGSCGSTTRSARAGVTTRR
jgi:hypothetical protein